MLNETSRRKPNFDERNSSPVVLADGQTWYLPKPWLEVRPIFRAGKAQKALAVFTNGPELDDLVEAIADADGLRQQVVGAASLAAHLLRWHYELSDADLDQLLCFRLADPASVQWVETAIAVATGNNGPKVSSAGGD